MANVTLSMCIERIFVVKSHLFLVADTQLYKRLCPSVGPSVRRSVRWSVMIESKSGKTRLPARPQLMAVYLALYYHNLVLLELNFRPLARNPPKKLRH